MKVGIEPAGDWDKIAIILTQNKQITKLTSQKDLTS